MLVDEKKEPGNYEVHFNAENLASGVYIYRMDTKNFTVLQDDVSEVNLSKEYFLYLS